MESRRSRVGGAGGGAGDGGGGGGGGLVVVAGRGGRQMGNSDEPAELPELAHRVVDAARGQTRLHLRAFGFPEIGDLEPLALSRVGRRRR